MPFAKRTVAPQRLCRSAGPGQEGSPPALVEDLCAVSNAVLSRTVRQLSDLARHAGSLFHELERELASTDRRLRDLRERVRRMERSTEELDPKQEAVREWIRFAPVFLVVLIAVVVLTDFTLFTFRCFVRTVWLEKVLQSFVECCLSFPPLFTRIGI